VRTQRGGDENDFASLEPKYVVLKLVGSSRCAFGLVSRKNHDKMMPRSIVDGGCQFGAEHLPP